MTSACTWQRGIPRGFRRCGSSWDSRRQDWRAGFTLPSGTTLIRAFVAAQMVHYMSVIAVLHFDPAHFSHHPVKAGLIIINGFLIVLITGLTARPQASPTVAGIHTSLLYLISFIFFAALLRDRFKPFRAAAVMLVLALILRLIVRMKSYRSEAKSASEVVTA